MNWTRKITLLVLICLSLQINVTAQKYQPAPIKTPDNFRGAEAIDQNSIGDLKWFEVFKDPALQSLVKTAMIQNYDLRTAGARINAARANLGLARSDQFPQFEASADLTSNRTSQNGQLGASGQGGQRRSFGSVLLNLLTFEIDVWGRLRNQTKAARAELRQHQHAAALHRPGRAAYRAAYWRRRSDHRRSALPSAGQVEPEVARRL